MSIDSPLGSKPIPPADLEDAIEVELPAEEEELEVEEEIEVVTDEFDSNLAEFLDERYMGTLAQELKAAFKADDNSREDWKKAYIDGLKALGTEIEDPSEPFEGACGITHPILSEAVVRFQSQAITELFPADGPVKTKIVGKATREKEQQSLRLANYMNYLTTDRMVGYREELEKLLFRLPLSGSAFKKVYYDPVKQRPHAPFVQSEHLVVNHGAESLETADRITHVMPNTTANDIRKLQASGLYRDIPLGHSLDEETEIQEVENRMTGEGKPYSHDDNHTLLEIHCNLDLEGYEDTDDEGEETGIALPYVVTIDSDNCEVLGVYRNWDGESKEKVEHFVHYEYIPGLGFYAFGLTHLMGGISRGATSILRQLVDAGTLANFPGGLKASTMRIKGDETPIQPGTWRDVDIMGGKISDSLYTLPYKEPSATLFALLQNIVEEGRRFASLNDMNASDMNQEAPVGTTLAILERTMKVMNAIHARLHASMRKELKILVRVVKENAPHEYPYDLDGEEAMLEKDFDDRIDVIPVSDPNASTMAQRIMTNQAQLQLAQTAPELYDLKLLHRSMNMALGAQDVDKVIPSEEEIPPRDPATENMSIIMSEPVKAFMWQDHEAHIAVHMAAVQDPKIKGILSQSPNAQAVQGGMAAHITEHVALGYRRMVEEQLGTPMPPPDQPMPEDVEVPFSKVVAEASAKVLSQNESEEQQKKIQEQNEDPIIQMQREELAIKKAQAQASDQNAKARLELDREKSNERNAVERERIGSKEESDDKDIMLELVKAVMKGEMDQLEMDSRQTAEQAKIAIDMLGLVVSAAEKADRIELEKRKEN